MTNPIYLKSQISALKAYRASLKRGTLSAYICVKPPSFYLFVPFSSFNATFSSESCCQSPSDLKKANHLFAVGDAPSVGFCGKGSNRLLSTLCPAAGFRGIQCVTGQRFSSVNINHRHTLHICVSASPRCSIHSGIESQGVSHPWRYCSVGQSKRWMDVRCLESPSVRHAKQENVCCRRSWCSLLNCFQFLLLSA